jgi:hypothetical protein
MESANLFVIPSVWLKGMQSHALNEAVPQREKGMQL